MRARPAAEGATLDVVELRQVLRECRIGDAFRAHAPPGVLGEREARLLLLDLQVLPKLTLLRVPV